MLRSTKSSFNPELMTPQSYRLGHPPPSPPHNHSAPVTNFTLKERITRNRILLLKASPFFGTLLLNAHWKVDNDKIPTAATDGQTLLINEHWMGALPDDEFKSILLHEVLHMALEHPSRLKDAWEIDPVTANLACDIVVNGIIDDNHMPLTKGAIRDNKLKHLSAREIWQILRQKQEKNPNYIKQKYGIDNKSVNICLVKSQDQGQGKGEGEEEENKDGKGDPQEGQDGEGNPQDSPATNWKDVLNKASVIARMKQAGPTGAGLNRIFKELLEPTINWRDILYKYVTQAKTDFADFDRRFFWRGLYLDDLGGEKIRVIAFVDTSGSVDEELLGEFVSELRFAVNSLPTVEGELWYFDTKLYPQGDIMEINGTPKLQGGGGTDFKPAMVHLAKAAEEDSTCQTLGIIFTDGYASMTNWRDPETPLLWCICPGGIDDETVPIGEVVRILK